MFIRSTATLQEGIRHIRVTYNSSKLSPVSSVSFLGVMCSRVLLNKNRGEEIMGECPLPAIKVSLDWLKLRPSVFHEAALVKRQ